MPPPIPPREFRTVLAELNAAAAHRRELKPATMEADARANDKMRRQLQRSRDLLARPFHRAHDPSG